MEDINNLEEHQHIEALRIRGGGHSISSNSLASSNNLDSNSDIFQYSDRDSDKSIQISTRVGNVVIEDVDDTFHRKALREEFQTSKQLEFDITSITMEDCNDSINTEAFDEMLIKSDSEDI